MMSCWTVLFYAVRWWTSARRAFAKYQKLCSTSWTGLCSTKLFPCLHSRIVNQSSDGNTGSSHWFDSFISLWTLLMLFEALWKKVVDQLSHPGCLVLRVKFKHALTFNAMQAKLKMLCSDDDSYFSLNSSAEKRNTIFFIWQSMFQVSSHKISHVKEGVAKFIRKPLNVVLWLFSFP